MPAVIPCPLGECKEIGRFGYRPRSTSSKKKDFHGGADFYAGCNTAVYLPTGSVILGGRTKEEYIQLYDNEKLDYGKTVFLYAALPSGIAIKLLHLNDVSASLVVNGAVSVGSVVADGSQPVAWTGNTGNQQPWSASCAKPLNGIGAHLHMEAFAARQKCHVVGGVQTCEWIPENTPIDPFPLMVASLEMYATPPDGVVGAGDPLLFTVVAKSSNDKLISSDIDPDLPQDHTGRPPTVPRFLCFSAVPENGVTWDPVVAISTTQERCLPWRGTYLGNGLAGTATGLSGFVVSSRYDTLPASTGTSFVPDTTGSLAVSKAFALARPEPITLASVDQGRHCDSVTYPVGIHGETVLVTTTVCNYTPSFTFACADGCVATNGEPMYTVSVKQKAIPVGCAAQYTTESEWPNYSPPLSARADGSLLVAYPSPSGVTATHHTAVEEGCTLYNYLTTFHIEAVQVRTKTAVPIPFGEIRTYHYAEFQTTAP